MPSLKKKIIALLSVIAISTTPLTTAAADEETLKTTPLVELLNLKSASFDSNLADFDIFTALFMDVWGLIPESDIQQITMGSDALTAFIPNDRAFRRLVTFLTGKTLSNESNIAMAVMNLGEETVESVLLYHIVPNVTISSDQALSSNGVALQSLSGDSFTVKVSGSTVTLVDKKSKHTNPVVLSAKADLNAGNLQIAHGINQVLLP